MAAFAAAFAFLLALAPSAPFTRELGVCESGAVRDVLAQFADDRLRRVPAPGIEWIGGKTAISSADTRISK